VGSFDGVHLGHRLILREVVRAAREARGSAAVLTMRPHPREFFSPDNAPNLLTSEAKKLRLFEELGMDAAFLLKFDRAVADLDPVHFLQQVVCGRCHAKHLIVGHDFRFGKDARGDYALLTEQAPQLGFALSQVPAMIVEGERVSSTLVRERILQGDLDNAEGLLGRKYSIHGEVIPGRGMGIELGFPTANIKPHHSAVPAHGVYVAEALLNKGRYPAAVNIGIAPTIRHEDITIEAFLLNFSNNILGRDIEIVFHKRLRPEKKFPSPQALADQIRLDVELVRRHFR
jgi:riboflavin kinase/FMN adenylyltransferase